jgi:hypothetical protein
MYSWISSPSRSRRSTWSGRGELTGRRPRRVSSGPHPTGCQAALERFRVLVARRPAERRRLELGLAAGEAVLAGAAVSLVRAPLVERSEPGWYTRRGRPRPLGTSSTRSLPLSRSSLRICRARGCDKPTALAASTAVIGLLVTARMIAVSRSAVGARSPERRGERRADPEPAAAGSALAPDAERDLGGRAR